MRILMLTPYLPYPPSSGGQIRSYNLIKHLSKNHQITLCSLIKYDSERKYTEKLKKYCQNIYVFKRAEKPWTFRNIFKTGFGLQPFLVVRNFSSSQKKAIKKILKKEEFDIIHAETFYVCPHIPKTSIPIVLVDQTIEFEVYRHVADQMRFWPARMLFYLDVLKIKYWETFYWNRASRVVAVSERDASLMKRFVKGLNVIVVPNGVGEDLMEEVSLHYNHDILFQGNYSWLQNIEAARILAKEIFPKIRSKINDARLILSGQNTKVIEDLVSENVVIRDLKLDDIEGVKKTYQGSGVLVAPLYGPGGTRLKILGAMAAKLPVVTTKIGIEGIDAVNGESVLFGESSDDLVALTIKMLEDVALYKKIALNGRKLVDEKYDYSSISNKLTEVYKDVLESRGSLENE